METNDKAFKCNVTQKCNVTLTCKLILWCTW